MEKELMEMEELVTVTMDDGAKVPCEILGIFDCEGKDYVALLPTEGEDAENGMVYLYHYEEDENGEPILSNIEEDEEFEKVSDAFAEAMSEWDEEDEDEEE